jgi:hypothetical protein
VSASAVPAARRLHVICELARLASCRPCRARTYVTRRDGADRHRLAPPGQVSGGGRSRWQAMLAVYGEGRVQAGIVTVGEPGEACDDG